MLCFCGFGLVLVFGVFVLLWSNTIVGMIEFAGQAVCGMDVKGPEPLNRACSVGVAYVGRGHRLVQQYVS